MSEEIQRQQWLAARRQHITSTDAPAILGQSPWASPLTIFARKLGLEAEPEANERMELGSALQQPVAELFGRRSGRTVTHVEPFVLVRHKEIPWLASSLDAFQEDKDKGKGLLEVKLSDPSDKNAWMSEENVPLNYQIQLQHELLVTGMKWGTLCCLLRGAKLVTIDYDANEQFQQAMLGVLSDFWHENLVKHEAPTEGWEHPATKDALRALFPIDAGTVVAFPDEADSIAQRWDTLHAEEQIATDQLRAITSQKNALANRLKLWMQDARYAVLHDGSGFSWKSCEAKGYTVEPKIRRDFRRMTVGSMGKALIKGGAK